MPRLPFLLRTKIATLELHSTFYAKEEKREEKKGGATSKRHELCSSHPIIMTILPNTFGIRSYSCYLYIGLGCDLLGSCFHDCII